MRVLITGVSGFLGGHLARHLMAAGHRVSGTWFADRAIPEGVAAHEIDLADPDARPALAALFAEERPELVYHLAGLSHVGESWRRVADHFRVNVLGTETVIEAASRAAARVVFASSAEVYGAVPEAEQPLAEDRPLAPASPYALAKAAAERLVLACAADGLVVRLFNVVGPGQSPRFALPSFAAQLARVARGDAPPVIEVGNLEARRDFVHVADAVDALARIGTRGEAGGVYNLASGTAHSVAEALERLIAAAGLEVRVERDPARCRPVDQPLLVGDAGRLRELGWRPERGLDQAVADLWRESLAPPMDGADDADDAGDSNGAGAAGELSA